jgi:hypothetical protein
MLLAVTLAVTPPAVPLRLQAAAMSRLSSLLDGASGQDFLAFVGAGQQAVTAHGRAPGYPGATTQGGGGSSCGLRAVVGLLQQEMLRDGRAGGFHGAGGMSLLSEARQVRGTSRGRPCGNRACKLVRHSHICCCILLKRCCLLIKVLQYHGHAKRWGAFTPPWDTYPAGNA